MKKKEIKGLSAFELLEGLDDDMILSASLPEAAPVAPPTAGEKITAFFARMGKGGMAAAITGIVVAVAVLLGIALAGPLGVIIPPDTDPSHGIQNGTEADPDTNGVGVIPPLTETPEQEKGKVAVVSDGITVYPKGYCVYISEMRRNESGELTGVDADGAGAVSQLGDIWDSLPTLRTAGNTYELPLPDHMTLRDIRVFEMISLGYGKAFEEIALSAKGTNPAIDLLNTLTGKGGYVVVLDIYTETRYSEDEYTKSLYEYAFWLEVDPSLNFSAPVRVIHGDKTYFPTGYLLEESYYDAELKLEVTKPYDGAEKILKELVKDMVTATVTQGESLSLYLAPFYDLKSVKVYRNLTLWALSETEEPLTQLAEWDTGDYYLIITAAFMGTGVTTVDEYPIHIRIVEPPETTSCILVTGGGQQVEFEAEKDGFLAWREVDLSHIQGTPAASVIFADHDALRALPDMEITYGTPLTLSLDAAGDALFKVILYDAKGGVTAEGTDLSVVDTLENDGWDRGVILVLQIMSQISETERVCYEYAIDLTITQP